MSILVQVSELQERARVLTDIPAFTADTHVTTAMILDFVKQSAQKLAGLIQEAGASEQYLTLSTTLSTTANVATVSLPANSMDVIRVALVIDGTREAQLNAAPLDYWAPDNSFWSELYLPLYRAIGNTLTFYPTPQQVYDVRVYYTVGFTVTATSDYLALRNNWDEFIVNDVCVRIRNRQNKAAQEFMQERAVAEDAIRRQLRRDLASPRTVRDLRCHTSPYPVRRRGFYE